MLLLAYVILEFAVMYPVIPTIIGNILGKSFNVFTTAISALMELINEMYKYKELDSRNEAVIKEEEKIS